MKKFILILSALVLSLSSWAQNDVLFTVGNLDVGADEFKAVYEKNKGIGAQVDPKTPEEYLDLYIKFKLKIAEAYELQRDTAESFVSEFKGYRDQLAKPYLNDPTAEEDLIQEAYERLQSEVRAAHIMYALDASALPSDTALVYNEMLRLRTQIEQGALSFEEAARTKSADTWSAKQGGDLGFFTAFSMVYPFESAAYSLAAEQVSMPIRTQYGYHLIKLLDKRPASGTVKVRQIFFASGEDADLKTKQRAERSAKEIFNRLQKGESFEDLVAFSEDRKTKNTGGEMPEFGINKMMPSFEEAAFALNEPGDYSLPVQTNIGWHVIQLISKRPLGSFEELQKEIARKVKRDSRGKLGAAKFVKQLRKDLEFSVNERNYDRTVALVDIAAFKAGEFKLKRANKRDYVVATYADQNIMQSQLLSFWKQNMRPGLDKVEEFLRMQFDVVATDAMIGYEDGRLESKYPEFRNLVREYKEGILLFDLTQDMVWNKAANDSVGIYNQYQKIKEQYMWEDRIAYSAWVCTEQKVAKKIAKWSKKDKTDKIAALLKSEQALSVVVNEGTAQQKDDELLAQVWQTVPGIYGPVALDGGYVVLQVKEFLPAQPKALKEVKGLVIASYQDVLEKEWVKSLSEKFEVKVNSEVKAQLFQTLK